MPRWIKIMLTSMGLLFICVGVGVGVFGTRAAQRHVAYLRTLTPVGAVGLSTVASGKDTIVAGVLSDRNPVLFREYVSYIREELRVSTSNDGKRREEWRGSGRETPPLVVDADGEVTIGNTGYGIARGHETWYDPATLNFSDRPRDGTKRYTGLIAGMPVTVYGTVAHGANGNEITAQTVFGGTHAEFLASEQANADFLPIFGAIFGVVGTILAGLGIFFAIRW